MSDPKHICDFSYCKLHQECLYKNATSVLKNYPCEAKVGHEENANIIVCYQKGLDTSVYANSSDDVWNTELKLRENSHKASQPHCQNPKCNSVADTRFNGEILLCFKCVDLLREYKTNYELGTIFKKKDKIVKLLKVIDVLTIEPKREMVRCSNIYCGTVENITRHHLVPRPYRDNLLGKHETIPLYEYCHRRVHSLKTNTQLARCYNTKGAVIDLLGQDKNYNAMRVLNVYNEMGLMAVA